MIIFNHIPRTGGTFLIEKLRQSKFGLGPTITFNAQGTHVPRLLTDDEYRPTMLIYHVAGSKFERTFHRRSGDFVFTFLRNRVDMVYSNFTYMQERIKRGDSLPGWTATDRRYFERSIEDHVDTVLTSHTPDVEYPTD